MSTKRDEHDTRFLDRSRSDLPKNPHTIFLKEENTEERKSTKDPCF